MEVRGVNEYPRNIKSDVGVSTEINI